MRLKSILQEEALARILLEDRRAVLIFLVFTMTMLLNQNTTDLNCSSSSSIIPNAGGVASSADAARRFVAVVGTRKRNIPPLAQKKPGEKPVSPNLDKMHPVDRSAIFELFIGR